MVILVYGCNIKVAHLWKLELNSTDASRNKEKNPELPDDTFCRWRKCGAERFSSCRSNDAHETKKKELLAEAQRQVNNRNLKAMLRYFKGVFSIHIRGHECGVHA